MKMTNLLTFGFILMGSSLANAFEVPEYKCFLTSDDSLKVSVQSNNIEAVKNCPKKVAKIDQILFEAVKVDESGEMLKLLITNGAKPEELHPVGEHLLEYSAKRMSETKNSVNFDYLLSIGVGKEDRTINVTTRKNGKGTFTERPIDSLLINTVVYMNTPINLSFTEDERVEYLGKLLDAGADINAQNFMGWTPLYSATRGANNYLNYGDSSQIVQFLLEKGANPNITSNSGTTVLGLSLLHGAFDRVQLLLDKGANPNQLYKPIFGSNKEYFPIGLAISNGRFEGVHYQMTEALLQAGANPNLFTKDEFHPLVKAERNEDLIELLVEFGATLD